MPRKQTPVTMPQPAIPRPGEAKRGPQGYLGYLLRQANTAFRGAMDRALAECSPWSWPIPACPARILRG
jgi:hypothetical protein